MKNKQERYNVAAKKDFGIKNDMYLCLMLSVFPLFIQDYKNVTWIKFITFVILSVLLLVAVLYSFVGMMLDGYRIKKNFDKKLFLKPEFYLFAYGFVSLVSYAFSPYKDVKNPVGQSTFWFGSGRYDGFLLLLLYFAVFICIANWGELKKRHIVICAVTVLVMCIVSVLQMCGINVLELYPKDVYTGRVTSFTSTVGNLGVFSAIFCVFIPLLVLSYVLLNFNKLLSAVLLLAQLSAWYIMMQIGVNSGEVGLAVTALIVLPICVNNAKNLPKLLDCFAVFVLAYNLSRSLNIQNWVFKSDAITYILFFITALFILMRFIGEKGLKSEKIANLKLGKIIALGEISAIILFVGYIYFFVEGSYSVDGNTGLLAEISDLLHGKINKQSGTYRIAIWELSVKAGIKNPLLGTGIGTFMHNMYQHFAEEITQLNIGTLDTAHNEYIQLFCTVGILGLMAYLGFLLSVALLAFKNINKNPYILITGSAVLCYCVQAFFNFSVVISTPFFWIFIALLYKFAKNTKEEILE